MDFPKSRIINMWTLSFIAGPIIFAISMPVRDIDWAHVSANLLATILVMCTVSFSVVWTVYGVITILSRSFRWFTVMIAATVCFCYMSHGFVQHHLEVVLSSFVSVRLNTTYPPMTIFSSWSLKMLIPAIWMLLCIGAGMVFSWLFRYIVQPHSRAIPQEKTRPEFGRFNAPIRFSGMKNTECEPEETMVSCSKKD